MKVACFMVLLVMALISVLEATTTGRKSQIRFLNSMPQFGKAKFSASTPNIVMFDQVPQGYLTEYASIESQKWNFTTQYATNVTAKSDQTDLDSDSYATAFTCQTAQKKLKNKLIYDTARSSGAKVALLRTVNLAQFDYSIDVSNGSKQLFNGVSYCSASSYIAVTPGIYELQWSISDKKRSILNIEGNLSFSRIAAGKVYTFYTTPTGSLVVADATTKKTRSLRSELMSLEAEDAPPASSEVKDEKNEVEVRRKKISKRSKRRQRPVAAQQVSKAG